MNVVFLALAISAMSFIFSITGIYLEIREYLSKIHPKIEQLVHCPFCISFYITVLVLFFCKKNVIDFSDCRLLNFFLTVFTIMAISAIVHFVLLRTYEPVSKAMLQRKIRNSKSE